MFLPFLPINCCVITRTLNHYYVGVNNKIEVPSLDHKVINQNGGDGFQQTGFCRSYSVQRGKKDGHMNAYAGTCFLL